MADRAWTHLGQQTFEEDWAVTREVAERGNGQQKRLESAQRDIMGVWGDNAEELLKRESWYTAQRIRTLSLRYSNVAEAMDRLNRAIISRIRDTRARNRRWKIEPQAKDYVEAILLENSPEITREDLDRSNLYINDAGRLRQHDLPSGGGFVEGTLPPDTPVRPTPALTFRPLSASVSPPTRPLQTPTFDAAVQQAEKDLEMDVDEDENDDDKSTEIATEGDGEEEGSVATPSCAKLAGSDSPLPPEACGCSADVTTEWMEAMKADIEYSFTECLDLLSQTRSFDAVCDQHWRDRSRSQEGRDITTNASNQRPWQQSG